MRVLFSTAAGLSLADTRQFAFRWQALRARVYPCSHVEKIQCRLNRRYITSSNRLCRSDELVERIRASNVKMAWGSPDSAESDFRSDVITRPSIAMLVSLIETTLGDDVFREDDTTIQFEQEVAAMLGHEEGCFVATGTMANQLALRALLYQPPYGILCDTKAHIINYEAAGPTYMSGAMIQAVVPGNGKYLTVNDVESHAVVTDDIHKCPTRVISLENTCAGLAVPLADIAEISKWSRKREIKVHLDGARLWEAVAAGAGTLKQYGKLFDSVAVDFSKGLGAPMGAMVLGNVEMIHQIRRIRKNIGGGLRQAGVLSSMARAALKENFGDGDANYSILRDVHRMARMVGEMWTSRGGRLLQVIETNQVWIDLDAISIQTEEFNKIGMQHGVKLDGRRIVLHHQVDSSALSNLERVFEQVLQEKRRLSNTNSQSDSSNPCVLVKSYTL